MVHVITRQTRSGARYLVRAKPAGRFGPILHLGSFKSKEEARAVRAWAMGELAHGRIPDRLQMLRNQVETKPAGLTVAQALDDYLAVRVDLGEGTLRTYTSQARRMQRTAFAKRDVHELTGKDVHKWLQSLIPGAGRAKTETGDHVDLAPGTLRNYLKIIRGALDHAGATPNPARSAAVKLPRMDAEVADPPSGDHVRRVLVAAKVEFRLPLALLDACGLRAGEAQRLTWGDMDVAAGRLRIKRGKTGNARRFVRVPGELLELLLATCPLEDRVAERPVFPGLGVSAAGREVKKVCQLVGVPAFTPHDLRHRWISRQIAAGVPITDLQAEAGHGKKSVTLDTYGHVLVDDVEAWRVLLEPDQLAHLGLPHVTATVASLSTRSTSAR